MCEYNFFLSTITKKKIFFATVNLGERRRADCREKRLDVIAQRDNAARVKVVVGRRHGAHEQRNATQRRRQERERHGWSERRNVRTLQDTETRHELNKARRQVGGDRGHRHGADGKQRRSWTRSVDGNDANELGEHTQCTAIDKVQYYFLY